MSRKAENSIHIDLVGPRIALRFPMSYNTRATKFKAQRTTSVKASLTRVPRNFSTRLLKKGLRQLQHGRGTPSNGVASQDMANWVRDVASRSQN